MNMQSTLYLFRNIKTTSYSDLCQNEDGKNYCMKQKNGTFCCICLFDGNQFSKHGILCILCSTTATKINPKENN